MCKTLFIGNVYQAVLIRLCIIYNLEIKISWNVYEIRLKALLRDVRMFVFKDSICMIYELYITNCIL